MAYKSKIFAEKCKLSDYSNYKCLSDKKLKNIVFSLLFFLFSAGLYAQFQIPLSIRHLAYNPTGDRIIACVGSNELKILNANNLSEIKSVSVPGINIAIYSPNGENIICALNNGQILVLNKNGNVIKNSALGDTKLNSIAFNDDGTILVSGSEGRNIRLVDPKNWNFYNTLPRQESKVLSVAFAEDNKVIAGLENGTIAIINIENNNVERILRDKAGPVSYIFTNNDYSYFISGVRGKGFTAWDLSDYSILYTNDLSDTFNLMTMSPDGRKLATLEKDNRIGSLLKIWNPNTGDNITSGGGITLSDQQQGTFQIWQHYEYLSMAFNTNAENLTYGGIGFISSISFKQTRAFGDFEFQLINDDNEIALTRYNGLGGEVTIPRYIFFIPVTKISKNTFVFPAVIDKKQEYSTYSITKINIPDTITEIEEGAFVIIGHRIEEIIIPDSVKKIGAEALPFYTMNRVTIGSNVNFTIGRVDDFPLFYNENGKKAGVYVRNKENRKWGYLEQ